MSISMRGGARKKARLFCAGSDEIKAQQPKTQKQTPWRPGLETYFSRDYRPKGGGVKILARRRRQHPAACHSLGTSDAQRLRTARCAGATVSCADRQEARSIARSMDRLRGCVREADRARFWMTHTCVGPVRVSPVRVPCSRNARALCPNEYAVSFIHQVRPLNR